MRLRFTPTQRLYSLAILASMAFSLWLTSNILVNNDGILYLQTAQAYLQSGFEDARNLYGWPFYSILIALMHQLTHLPLEQAAFLLDNFLCVLIVTGFIALTKKLGGNFQVQVCAAIVILCHIGFNEYREYIIRDFGHWAFLLYALYFLIAYAQKPRLHWALAWGCSIGIACLFRIEALFIMLFAPLVILLPTEGLSFKKRLLRTLGAYMVFIILLITAFISILLNNRLFVELFAANQWVISLNRLHFKPMIFEKLIEFRQIIPSFVKNNELGYMLTGALLSYFFVRLFLLISPFYTLLTGVALYKKSMPSFTGQRILWACILIYTSIILGFLFYRFFLTGRYIMPVALLLSLWAPFGLSAIYDAWKKRKTWLFPASVALLLYMLIDSLYSFGTSQLYIRDAGVWMKTHLSANNIICTNNKQVSYYSQIAIYKEDTVTSWQGCNYLAVFSVKDSGSTRLTLQNPALTSIKVFTNEKDNRIEIYKTARGRNRTGTGD